MGPWAPDLGPKQGRIALFLHVVDFSMHGINNLDLKKLYSFDKEKISKEIKSLNLLRMSDIEKIINTNGFLLENKIVYRKENIKGQRIDKVFQA